MKVAVITLHHVRNYGSLLQTYATQEILKKLNCEVEIIDFIPKGLTLSCGIKTIKASGNLIKDIIRKLGASLVFSIEQADTVRFLNKNISLTKQTYHNFDELLASPPLADAYISGSDQIWNTQNANLPTDILAYYLEFAPEGKKRIAYASSIGKTEFSDDEAENVKSHLEKYCAIGVREKQAVELLKTIGIEASKHVLDPTLLLTPNEWKSFLGKQNKEKPYIFVYNLNRNPHIKSFASLLSREKNLPIINFAHTLDFIPSAKNRLINSAYDFLYYLSNAEYVITDSFHGTAFSINFGKQFLTFSAPKFNSRIQSILELFSLESRLSAAACNDITIIDKPLDKEGIERALSHERKTSLDFLKSALED